MALLLPGSSLFECSFPKVESSYLYCRELFQRLKCDKECKNNIVFILLILLILLSTVPATKTAD